MVTKHRFPSRLIALLFLLLPLIAACGGETAQPPQTAPTTASQTEPTAASAPSAEQPQTSSDVLDVTVSLPYLRDGITSFDHAFWTSQLLVTQGTIFEGLYGYDPQLNVVPKVAESATPSQDNTVWTIKLRKDKKWSNGDPVTAKDFYAAWVRLMSPELKDAPMWAGTWGQIKNGWAFKSGAVKADEVGVKLVDDYTLEVTLIEPNAAFINLLPISTAMPINAKSLQEHPDDWWKPEFAVFNGPYVVKSWVSGGDITLTRNPNYVGDGLGNVGTIILKPYADANTRLQAFENGEIHFTFLEDASQVAYAENVPAMKDNLKSETQDLGWRGLQFNRAVDPGPLSDIRVRQAFAMAIDKKAITENVLKGLATPNDTFNAGDVAAKIKPLPFDVAKAKALLAEAGYPDGKGFPEITFYAPQANDPQMPVIEAVVKMWQDNLGVPIVIQNNEGPVYSALQWSDYNKDIKPGYATLGGTMNWFQPLDLMLSTGHVWWFMDFKPGGVAKYADYKTQINEVKNVAAVGDWAALEQRAKDVWAKRLDIIAKENNEWGASMKVPPTFEEQFAAIAKRFSEATDEATKLTAYQDGLSLVLGQEQSVAQYEDMTDTNRKAQNLLIKLRQSSVEQGWEQIPDIQQLAIDSAWMIPLYNDKLIYTTDPRLSGIVLNKLAWGHIFQFQYLQWKE